MTEVKGIIVDVMNRKMTRGVIVINKNQIQEIREDNDVPEVFIIPGFVDAHIHIESSMLTPYNFAKTALTHGTVATVSDPHEIANVCGIQGVEYMLDNAKGSKLKFYFGAPSCVPATSFETSGASIDPDQIEELLSRNDIHYLSEMMNYPGVINDDEEVLKKIAIAKQARKPVDGHAPGLKGQGLKKYIEAGISTDHECFTIEEALEKLDLGMRILIREGSAARNFEALHPLITKHPDMVMLCSDDKHPDELMDGHINELVSKAVALGHDVMDVLQTATVNPVEHYKLNVGLLRKGDTADFIAVEDLKKFKVLQTWIEGELVAENGTSILKGKDQNIINNFTCTKKEPKDFECVTQEGPVSVIGVIDGQLMTKHIKATLPTNDGSLNSDVDVGFIKGIGIKEGAFASTVAHDSHNIIVAGVDNQSMCKATNLLIDQKGGLSVVNASSDLTLPLPIAGLMSDGDCNTTANAYSKLDKMVKAMGSELRAPFMTLSFMALLVIPKLKLSDKGLFDGTKFEFV
jgi:adenine deaminase